MGLSIRFDLVSYLVVMVYIIIYNYNLSIHIISTSCHTLSVVWVFLH